MPESSHREVARSGELFELHRDRLRRLISRNLDPRLRGRLSPEDVLQEAFLDVGTRIGEYLSSPDVPLYVWLRFLTLQRMRMIERGHLTVAMRSVKREIPLTGSGIGRLGSRHTTSASKPAMRRELRDRLRSALRELAPTDRQLLELRHFEELSNSEIARRLGLSKDAASKRYIRALTRLREVLRDPRFQSLTT